MLTDISHIKHFGNRIEDTARDRVRTKRDENNFLL